LSSRSSQILKQLSFRKAWNVLLLKSSFYISSILKKPIHWGTPMAVSIEPTTACNLRCPQCPSGLRQFSRPTGNLKINTNEKILEGLGKNLQYINYYFQGEPFINPDFLSLVKSARKRGIYVLTSTNAHFISSETADKVVDSGLSEVIISIDGTTQETYEDYRIEGDLAKVLEGTRNLVKSRANLKSKFPIITFQFLVTQKNEHQIPELQKIADEIGVDNVNLKTIQIYDFEKGNDLIPQNQKYSRYKKDSSGNYKIKNKLRNSCWRSWSSCVFTWDGSVVPCCFDKDAKHEIGNISKSEFKTIWKGAINKDFRQKVLRNRNEIDICKNCSEGSKVWI
jgi:radical SAM protein with 4Fe4S-binding SPASM domain